MRTTNGASRHRSVKRVKKMAKGYYGSRRTMFYIANETVERALAYGTRDRRVKKRDFRKLWIARINAAARVNGISYSAMIAGLKKKNVGLDRRVLAALAVTDPAGFTAVAALAKG